MKLTIKLLFICLIGFLHWFFGNLYEVIVFTPNILLAKDQVAMLTTIRDLYQVSAPYYYYLPWSPLSILGTIFLWFMLRRTDLTDARRWITLAAVSGLGAGLVTGYIIVDFNLTLWVGSASYTTAELTNVLWQNTAVGLLRLSLVGTTVYFLYRATRPVMIAQIRSARSL